MIINPHINTIEINFSIKLNDTKITIEKQVEDENQLDHLFQCYIGSLYMLGFDPKEIESHFLKSVENYKNYA